MNYATLYVWHIASGGALGISHGAVEVDQPPTYITWLGERFRQSPEWLRGWIFQDDAGQFGYVPDHTVKIPLFDAGAPFGLDGVAMSDWWRMRRLTNPAYHLISKTVNCDGTVVEALLAGGAAAYAEPPRNILYQGSATLLRWAQLVKQAMADVTDAYRYAEAGPAPVNAGGLWTLAEWKQHSARGGMTMRMEQVHKIDKLLEQYHRDDRTGSERFGILCKILVQAVDHLRHKPHSDRRPAVQALCAQVLAHIQALNAGDTIGGHPKTERRMSIII